MRRLVIAVGTCCAIVALHAAPAPAQEPKLLIVSSRAGGQPQIFLVNADGSGAKNLTNNKSTNAYPAWSPDGKKIAFASDRDGTMNIYVMDADGGNVKALTKADPVCRIPTWSPDGKKIAFCQATENGSQIYVMDADGGNVKAVGGDGWDPAWSPDGKKILFTSFRSGTGFRLYVMDVDGKNTTELTNNDNPFGYVYPSWSPGGKKIAWTDKVGDALEIFTADADGKNAKAVTKLGGLNSYAAWSPDGKKLVFYHAESEEKGSFYVMDADGGNVKEWLKNEAPVEGGRPAWRPK